MSDNRVINHKLHIFLTFITLGAWWPFYLGLYLYYKFSNSTIDKRRELRDINKELSKERKEINEAKKVEQRKANYAKEVELLKAHKGYKQGKNQMYVLSCTHQIRANKATGLISKGLVGRTVWCDVCNADRLVTGAPYWVK
jgi:hypothetical protein